MISCGCTRARALRCPRDTPCSVELSPSKAPLNQRRSLPLSWKIRSLDDNSPTPTKSCNCRLKGKEGLCVLINLTSSFRQSISPRDLHRRPAILQALRKKFSPDRWMKKITKEVAHDS